MNQRLLITLGIAAFLVAGTYVAVRWAQGYRFNARKQIIEGNGLLVASSEPKGASVYVNEKLTTATDDTLHLNPGTYAVRLERDGYFPWQKQLEIRKELVTETKARLFPSVPNLSALTLTGAADPHPSPDGRKIAYKVASGSAQSKHGIWVVNVNDNPLRQGSNALLIAKDTAEIQFSKAQLLWNPSSSEVLAYFSDNQAYILIADTENKPNTLINAAFQLPLTLQDWQQQLALERQRRLLKLPVEIQKLATESATLVYFSPNEEKILYTATASATIPDGLTPPLPAVNWSQQERELSPGNVYVYDSKEDTNFLIRANVYTPTQLEALIAAYTPPPLEDDLLLPTPSLVPSKTVVRPAELSVIEVMANIEAQYSPVYTDLGLQWFPNSYHLISTREGTVNIFEYDTANEVTVYAGPYLENFAYPWPNGQKLIILTSLTTNPDLIANLYGLNLE